MVRTPPPLWKVVVLGCGCVFLAALEFFVGRQEPIAMERFDQEHNWHTMHYFSDAEAEKNAAHVERNRRQIQESCRRHGSSTNNQDLSLFSPPAPGITPGQPRQHPQPCLYTFLDLLLPGISLTDRQDTSALDELIDAGLKGTPAASGCSPVRFSVTDCQLVPSGSHSTGTANWISETIQAFQQSHHRAAEKGRSPLVQPEQYCYDAVGMSRSNHHATAQRQYQLQQQQCIMHTLPRPLRSAHFYSEHLLLEPSTTPDNTALTLSTLLRETVLLQAGGHVMLRFFVAGSADRVVDLLIGELRALCDCAQHGVRTDIRIERQPEVRTNAATDCSNMHALYIIGPV